MVRFLIIGIVIAVAFTLYALVDAAMTDGSRARGVSKPVWVVLVVVLPVIGGILWFTIGKGSADAAVRPQAPDDDPRFTGTHLSSQDLDAHMRDLELRLRELDDEKYPGEDERPRNDSPEKPSAAPESENAENAEDGEDAPGAENGKGAQNGKGVENGEDPRLPGDDSGSARQ